MKLDEMALKRMTVRAAQSMHGEGVLCTVTAVVAVDGQTAVDVAFDREAMALTEGQAKAERQRIGCGVLAALQRSLGGREGEQEGGEAS